MKQCGSNIATQTMWQEQCHTHATRANEAKNVYGTIDLILLLIKEWQTKSTGGFYSNPIIVEGWYLIYHYAIMIANCCSWNIDY